MRLSEKIKNRSAIIGVIGLGYVGLSLAVDIASAGYIVYGFDDDKKRVQAVNESENYISSVADADLSTVVLNHNLTATTDMATLTLCDIFVICVPTPLNANKQPDISHIERSTKCIAEQFRDDTLVVLQSTTYPGTTNDIVKPILEKTGKKCGQDFFLAYSPERVDPGNDNFNSNNTPRIVGGMSQMCCDLATLFYTNTLKCCIHTVSTPDVAEMSKILENTYRNINIGFINEFATICNLMGIDVWEVIEAAKTKPFGFQVFYPGPGVGGHCIPLDPYYLSWKIRQYDVRATMIEVSGSVLESMPRNIVNRVIEQMNSHKLTIKGSEILLLGIAYKADVNDYRESPALKIFEILKRMGANIDYHDPFIPHLLQDGICYDSISLTSEQLRKYHLVIILTAHSSVDYALVCKDARLVFDTRNVLKQNDSKIVKL